MMETNCIALNRPGSFLALCLIFLMLYTTSEGFYRKPYVAEPASAKKIIPPKPKSKPTPKTPSKGSGGGHVTAPPEVLKGGKSGKYSTGWGITFNIWIWVEVKAITSNINKWEFRTTTVPSVVVEKWFTTEYPKNWGHQIRTYDDKTDERDKKRSGLDWTCFSWHKTCAENKFLRDRLIRDMKATGKMRSIGGGTDGTDNTLIAFIVIAVLIGAGIGGVMFYKRRDASSFAEDEGEPEDEVKKAEPAAEEGKDEEEGA